MPLSNSMLCKNWTYQILLFEGVLSNHYVWYWQHSLFCELYISHKCYTSFSDFSSLAEMSFFFFKSHF